MDINYQAVGYGLAGLVCLVLFVLLLTSFRGRLTGGLLAVATLVSAAWAAVLAWASWPPELGAPLLFLVEMVHDLGWVVFLSGLLRGAAGVGRNWLVRNGGIVLTLGIIAFGLIRHVYPAPFLGLSGTSGTMVTGSLLTALYVLVVLEQIYRNARESQRRGLKYLCLGVGGIFVFDLFLYSHAIFSGQVSELFWGVRGFVVMMCIPLIGVAAQRSPLWSVGIFVSREIVFYTATLFGAGVYLTVVGFAGYYLRLVGGNWGAVAQIVFVAAAIILLSVLLMSGKTRTRLRVFISKHFFANKYDYRAEWLRLINTLTAADDNLPLQKRGLKALTEVAASPAAVLWLKSNGSESLVSVSGWNTQPDGASFSGDCSLPTFLRRTGWIVDIDELQRDPSRYRALELDPRALGLDDAAYIVPLMHRAELLGFAVLSRPEVPRQLNFEDRDLLKTAGKQIASYLAQEIATEQLAEGRQFEAFNRLTAYLMHDLKNLIAQQSLLIENAQKHRGNPEFIDDALETIKGGVRRMRSVMEHLQQAPNDKRRLERVELGKLIMQTVSNCSDRRPEPRAQIGEQQVWIHADEDRLGMALHHAIRNAQDATDSDGEVRVVLTSEESTCRIQIVDNGVGMSEEFVRERLFRPFDSTKGVQGMGIGAYQLRETVRALGGEMHVVSTEGEGTSLVLELSRATP